MKAMKTKSILLFALVAAGVSSQSCLMSQEDVFEESPTVRMTEYLDNARQVLMSPEKGWLMCYYPDKSQSYGGYSYVVKFGLTSVDVGFELSDDPSATVSSLYSMGTDTGPTLSFDTNNDFLHYFSTPSSKKYQAYGGDFEFVLLEVEADHVKMMGRRSGNIIMMYPMTEDMTAYFTGLKAVAEDFVISSMNGTIGGVEVSASINASDRQVKFSASGESVSKAYMFTPVGISLYEPVSFGGVQVSGFDYDAETYSMAVVGSTDVLQGIVPEGHRRWSEYAGDYWLIYNRENEADVKYDSVRVSLVPGEKNSTYLMKGLNDNYDIVWQYNATNGILTWQTQTLGYMDNGYEVRLCAMDGATGGFTWPSNTVLGATEWNGDVESPVYRIHPQYTWSSTRSAYSFYLCCWDGSTRKSAPGSTSGWRFPKNSTSMKWLYSLEKIKE